MDAPPSPYAVGPLLWAELEPVAVDVDRRQRRTTRRVGAGIAAAGLGVAAYLYSGVWVPSLQSSGSGGGGAGQAEVSVHNHGLLPVDLTGPATISIPGLRVSDVATEPPIPAFGEGVLKFRLEAVDCGKVLAVTGIPTETDPFPDGPVVTLTATAKTWHGPVPVDIKDRFLLASIARSLCTNKP
ncbi:hypothetical protein [Propioniciclava tarda]|uniref:Uncharacterized protein n=1 Tax=Propioniciclava tarda TaxID=433330 RepID=A0A4Q9KHM6_PROTD|nr:hypothetical protein [Propioniciclava tarda]TBT91484.1 hypothetical protein ET996_13800 [Propioniciclava tarda]SMO84727.1 hypothetical protein SAMN06266982_1258 [Propioniciclava tarda]HOA89692.1 hypothetical protein [Propioniciclava tarda]HQA31872.1 hypothetical protein [Propioniciclava tarda]HQD61515.1 hypothetical protein [Propioniciclava tarda]